MKILILSKYYGFLDYFFNRLDVASINSYQTLHNSIINERYFWSDYFKQEIPAHGYDVEQLIIDAEPLQKLWAQDFGSRFIEKNWYFDIIFQQITHYNPEILFIQDWSKELGADFINLVKYKCPFVKIFIGYCGEGHPGPGYFKDHDIVISCAKDNVELFRKNGLAAYHIYHAFYPGILKQLGPHPEKNGELAFIGRVVATSWAHKERAIFLSKLSEIVPFALHGEVQEAWEYQAYPPALRYLYGNLGCLCRSLNNLGFLTNNRLMQNCMNFQEIKLLKEATSRLLALQHQQCFGLSMFDIVRKYKMLLNYHTSHCMAANLRMFEVTGMGTCLITDWKENIKELFDPDYEVVTYKNVEEAVEKISYLKNNPKKIDVIARAGQKRTLRDHTYKQRAYDMHTIFQDYLKNHYRSRIAVS